jgi:hypothetical protein
MCTAERFFFIQSLLVKTVYQEIHNSSDWDFLGRLLSLVRSWEHYWSMLCRYWLFCRKEWALYKQYAVWLNTGGRWWQSVKKWELVKPTTLADMVWKYPYTWCVCVCVYIYIYIYSKFRGHFKILGARWWQKKLPYPGSTNIIHSCTKYVPRGAWLPKFVSTKHSYQF